jgi:hypothetical protein
VEGRHFGLADIGAAMLLLAAATLLSRKKVLWLSGALVGLLVINQGNAWSSVVACRINRAVFETLREHRGVLSRSTRVVVDTQSFAERIPYTWGDTIQNRLDSYWGMQTFSPLGLRAMVRLATDPAKPVLIAGSRPVLRHGHWEFEEKLGAPGKWRLRRVPSPGTEIVDYQMVYGTGFDDGNRVNPGTP